jgi:DivIVA domain-containing protein
MTWLFAVLAFLVISGTALALAGRWRPRGMPSGPPPADRPGGAGPVRFDVVLRGYRMDQVDAELARLRAQLDAGRAAAANVGAAADATAGAADRAAGESHEMPSQPRDPTIER